MRRSVAFLAVSLCMAAGARLCAAGSQGAAWHAGLTARELRGFTASLPALPGPIQAMLLLQTTAGRPAVALATFGSRPGWRILVFERGARRKWNLCWNSGKLDDSFAVSSGDQLRIIPVGVESCIAFSGCAQHVCPDVFSALIYIPSKRRVLQATSVWGKTTYSPAVASQEDSSGRQALDWLIDQHRDP